MEEIFKDCLWKNFGAAIDMLKNAVELCPDDLWHNDKKFFYLSYHTVIFLDYYLTNPVRDFNPALPFTLVDFENLPSEAVDDVMPNELYGKAEIITYLDAVRAKCRSFIARLTEDELNSRWIEDSEIDLHGLCPPIVNDYTVLEILFYNFRHVQHHVAQLNFILRQKANTAADWISHCE